MSDGPIVRLTLAQPKTVNDVKKWAALADLLGVPSTSSVSMDGISKELIVHAYLAQLPDPDLEDDE